MIFHRHEVPFCSIHSQQIRHHLPSYRQRRSIGIPFLLFGFIDQGELVVLSRGELGGFHQGTLDMFVALLESGVRSTFSAELFLSPQSPQ